MMKKPPHPGLAIRDEIQELGLTVAEAAAGLGVTRQQLHRVISGKSNITSEMAMRLQKAIGGTAEMWLRLQLNYDLAQIQQRAGSIKVKRLVPA
jgi:antitoxin HigA-1